MKLIEKIAYITFGINILFVIFSFIILPVTIITVPDFIELLIAKKGQYILILTLTILNIGTTFHLVYCIWFLFKYDRYSKSIIPLFILNIFYAPIYFYRVKIKKRPLRNKIKEPTKQTNNETSIVESDFKSLTRDSILVILELWSSSREQLELQKLQPDFNVSEDLFLHWSELYVVDSEIIKESFSFDELNQLAKFNNLIKESSEKLNGNIPMLKDFIDTDVWRDLNSLAKLTLNEIRLLTQA
jgi:hypothetical protein